MPESRVLPFRWILPLGQLFLCAVILLPMWPDIARQIVASLRAYGLASQAAPKSDPPFTQDVTSPEWRRMLRDKERRERIVVLLNGLGGLPEVTYAIVSPAHTAWAPARMFTWTWLDISWPILATFFWFGAGRGIEALLGARRGLVIPRIRWWDVLLGLLILAYGTGLFAAMMTQRDELVGPWRIGAAIGLMWLAFGAGIVAARVVQWRLRRLMIRSEQS